MLGVGMGVRVYLKTVNVEHLFLIKHCIYRALGRGGKNMRRLPRLDSLRGEIKWIQIITVGAQ